MKIFNRKGEEIGEFIPKNQDKSKPQQVPASPGCVTAIVFTVMFAIYAIMDDTPSPTWYWLVSWVGFSMCSYSLLEPLTRWTEKSCLGMLVGLLLALAAPIMLIFAHMILTEMLYA